jgi:hypothetical protein
MADERFDLWLEFEHWVRQEGDDPVDDIFNMQIVIHGGKKYTLNVWTYKAIRRAVKDCRESGECLEGAYLLPPDLFVYRTDRRLLERIVADLIAQGGLRKEWEVPDQTNDACPRGSGPLAPVRRLCLLLRLGIKGLMTAAE